MTKTTTVWVAVTAVALLVAGVFFFRPHGEGTGPEAARAASGAGGAINVTTVQAVQRDVDVTLEATGAVSPLNTVEIRPQVSSTIRQVHIREGDFVKAGTLLFTLDARADEVNVTRAQAQLARDMAALADARRQLTRSKELLAQNFIAQGAVDTNQTLVDTQLAVVAADRAAIDAARVSLSYNRIVAPAAGRAGAINVYPGSYVQPSGTALVTITQIAPIAVSFNLPQRNLAAALQALRSGGGRVLAEMPEAKAPVTGKLQFVDNAVDAASGTVRVKAVFDNHDQALWPGAYVSVKLAVQTLKGAISVPQAAIVQGAKGRQVYVVGADRKAVLRPVELVEPIGTEAVVQGVRAGERVVVEGRQNVRPGVTLVEAENRGPGKGDGKGDGKSEAPASVQDAAGPSPAASGTSGLSATPVALATVGQP